MRMLLCVGAASRRIVEEAAQLRVHQIVASRRQVAYPFGYTGLAPDTLVKLVHNLSKGETQVVRDHGGPLQGGYDDDGIEAFDADVAAGFDGLHIDVCALPPTEQHERLVDLCQRYVNQVKLEIGGEHEHASTNKRLLTVVANAGIRADYVVIGAGTHVWADQQLGRVRDTDVVRSALSHAHFLGVKTKVHNMDWIGSRHTVDAFDAYNLAPELGQVEVRAILTMLPPEEARTLLKYAYDSGVWSRWFKDDEGTRVQRAECAIRYLLEDSFVIELIDSVWSETAELYVRGCVQDAIVYG